MTTDEKRGDARLPVMWHGSITTEDDNTYPCEVRDISLAGTLISVQAELPLGSELILNVPGLGEFAGEIRWAGNSALGLTLIAGPDLVLKKFAEKAGSLVSTLPEAPDD